IPAKAKAATASPTTIFLFMTFLHASERVAGPPSLTTSALDSLQARGDAALEQRPIKTEREGDIAALDHSVRHVGRARHAADRHAAFQNAGFGARHQFDHLGIVRQGAL